jgi:transposase-like protein
MNPAAHILEPVYDVEEAANILGISTALLNKWRVTGKGPAFIKLGRRVVYTQPDLLAFIEARRRLNTAEAKAPACIATDADKSAA